NNQFHSVSGLPVMPTHAFLWKHFVTISGAITLQGCANMAQPLTVALRPTNGGPSLSYPTTPAADGTFRLDHIPADSYQLAVKGAKWLQKVGPVDASGGDVSGVTMTLPAGDANNDNLVDLDDLGLLANAFNTQPGDPLWNADADLNCDGVVDIVDM